jgi:hypothetical protein
MGSINSQANFGSFVPTTNVWDVQQLQSLNIDPQLKELLVRLYQNINNISVVLNTKDSAYYVLEEFLNGQIYFPDPTLNSTTSQKPTFRQVFRTVINFGALPNAATKSVAHGIAFDTNYSVTRIYGATTNSTSTSFLPLPFVSTVLNFQIALNADATNVFASTSSDYSAYTRTYIVIEYIKS